MWLEVIEISTFNEGYFVGKRKDKTYVCQVLNKDMWDKLYDHLNSPVNIEIVKDNGILLQVNIVG